MTLTVVNDAPDAVNDVATTTEDAPFDIDVLANDTDPNNDVLSITSSTPGGFGTTVIVGSKIHYTPNANFNGTDFFTYTITDGHGGADTAMVTVTITPMNDNPVAANDTATSTANFDPGMMHGVTISVLDNDSDLDGDTLFVASMSNPAHGTLVNNGNAIQYTPELGFQNGTDTFQYTVSDGHGGTATATVTVTVTGGGGGGGGGSGTISGRVFHDGGTHNGIQDSGEDFTDLTGMMVQLLDLNNTVEASTPAMMNGDFTFTNVAAGSYRLKFLQPSGFVFTAKDVGMDDGIDSDVSATTGESDLFSLPIGGSADIDAGIYLG